MAEQNGQARNKSFSQRVFRWVTLLVILALFLSLAWAQPAGAGSGVQLSGVPAPSVPQNPIQTLRLSSYNLPLQQGAQPPVPNQGGTCISGFLIDSYHQPLGAGWQVSVTPQGGAAQTQTTSDTGTFKFTGLAGGTYTVELMMPDVGWRAFTPVSFSVTLSGNGDGCAEVRFKLEADPCIEVVKVDAKKVDGKQVGIPDWGFTLTQGETSVQGRTDGQGKAFFYNLIPGTWTITEENKRGWRPASGYNSSTQVDVVSPQVPGTCEVVLFVNEQVSDACITVQKADVAGNPVKDWSVSITRDDGTQAPAQGMTDKNGQVTFNKLALGNWTVTEETKEWWRPVGETSQRVVLEEPGVCQVVKFINEPLGCVDGFKINDLDEGLSGWQIDARNTDTGEQFSAVTDANGYFKINTLSLGAWTISENLQEGWEPVTAPSFTVQVTEPFTCQTVRFKNRTQYACVDVFKKDETDGAGLPGWNITLQPAYGGQPVSGITDGTGWVRFNQLTPGTYTIKEDLVNGWTSVSPTQVTVDLAASGRCAEVNFVNVQTNVVPDDPPSNSKDKNQSGKCALYYTVQSGNTVWGIGMWFGVSTNAIAQANHLKNPSKIYVGQRLCIPVGDP
ncbi:MAG: Conserved repeat domain protein [Chloroflexi bacterium]|nr:Conserved repeat domain protein [Chloroflexota bacterium]